MPPTPKLATDLLRRFGPNNEALAGDLAEGFHQRGSRFWYWRQVIAAILDTAHREIWHHKLAAVRAIVVGSAFVWFVFAYALTPIIHFDEWLFATGLMKWFYLNGYGMPGWFVRWMLPVTVFATSGWMVGRTHRRYGSAVVLAYTYSAFALLLWGGPWHLGFVSPTEQLFLVLHFPMMLVACPLAALVVGLWAVGTSHARLRV